MSSRKQTIIGMSHGKSWKSRETNGKSDIPDSTIGSGGHSQEKFNSGITANQQSSKYIPPFRRQAANNKRKASPNIGFSRLYNYLESSTEEILLSISKDKDDWKELLQSKDLIEEKLIVAIQVIGEKICVDIDVLKQQQANVLEMCCNKRFILKLENIASNILDGKRLTSRWSAIEPQPHYRTLPVDTSHHRVLSNIYNLCDFIIKILPENGVNYFMGLIKKSFTCSSTHPDIQVKFEKLVEKLKEHENIQTHAELTPTMPHDHIKDISLLPLIKELRNSEEPVPPQVPANGAYTDSSHYLDVQFRILRENLVQQIRKGVQVFLNDNDPCDFISGKKTIPSMHLYPNVRITKVLKENGSTVYKLQLPENFYEGKAAENWEKSRKIQVQNLALLTSIEDPFQSENTFFGVIFSRHLLELTNGIVTVKWEGVPPSYVKEEKHLLFEFFVNFGAYRQTLDTLRHLKLDLFSLKKFIVDLSNKVEPPKYIENFIADRRRLKLAYSGRQSRKTNDEWPPAENFGLDKDQLLALRGALCKNITLIQGPPGTGKTYLGQKMVEVIWNNHYLWEAMEGSPITVVCQTDHALDQFLVGIVKYYDRYGLYEADVIRLGGHCQSELLMPYLLGEVSHRGRNQLPRFYKANETNCLQAIAQLEEQRLASMGEIIDLKHLQGVIDFKKLSCWKDIKAQYPLLLWDRLGNTSWLGLDDTQPRSQSFSAKIQVRKWFHVLKAKVADQKDKMGNLDDDFEHTNLEEVLTSDRTYAGNTLQYLPNGSFRKGSKNPVNLTESFAEPMNLTKNVSRHELERDEMVYQTRDDLLKEIFNLYHSHVLDLPNVTDILRQIREENSVNFNQLKMDERWALYVAIVEEARVLTMQIVKDIDKQLIKTQEELKCLRRYWHGLIVRASAVVGLTASNAAKYSSLLRQMKSKIVIVEEAGEILEAYVLASLTEHCEQLILIGDHGQPRLSPSKNCLHASMLERMLSNNFHIYQLKVQHGMKRQDLYYHLDLTRFTHPVLGIRKSVFFVSLAEEETTEDILPEPRFVASLCRHLILQGYRKQQITVLTTSVSQISLLKHCMKMVKVSKGILVDWMDNIPRKKNDIIIMSLANSGEEIKVNNQICVALSRAKIGFYFIGAKDEFEKWKEIKGTLESKGCIGDGLELQCQNHGSQATVYSDLDFTKVCPDGGCTQPCDISLPCGHKCPDVCHILNLNHEDYKCRERCKRLCANNLHPCNRLCFKKCFSCTVKVEKTLLCGHKVVLQCHWEESTYKCREPHEQTLPCGHECTFLGYPTTTENNHCRVNVNSKLNCGHEVISKCGVDPMTTKCIQVETIIPPCSHVESLPCHLTAKSRLV